MLFFNLRLDSITSSCNFWRQIVHVFRKLLIDKGFGDDEEVKPQANGLPLVPHSRRIRISSSAQSTSAQSFHGTSFASASSYL